MNERAAQAAALGASGFAPIAMEFRVTNSARVNGSIPRRLLMLAFGDIEPPLCNGRHDRMQLQEACIPKQLASWY